MLALEAFDADVCAEPDYLPFGAAAGVLFLEGDDVAELDDHNHCRDNHGDCDR